jgi:hypothetical protein
MSARSVQLRPGAALGDLFRLDPRGFGDLVGLGLLVPHGLLGLGQPLGRHFDSLPGVDRGDPQVFQLALPARIVRDGSVNAGSLGPRRPGLRSTCPVAHAQLDNTSRVVSEYSVDRAARDGYPLVTVMFYG